MTRIIIAGGFVGELSLVVEDSLGADLSLAGLRMALVPLGGALPPKGDLAWKLPTSSAFKAAEIPFGTEQLGKSEARITFLISLALGYTLGKYKAWVLASLSPAAIPLCAKDEVIELV